MCFVHKSGMTIATGRQAQVSVKVRQPLLTAVRNSFVLIRPTVQALTTGCLVNQLINVTHTDTSALSQDTLSSKEAKKHCLEL